MLTDNATRYQPPMLAEALRLMRVYHDMNQVQLSRKLCVSTAMISEMERGNKTPSMEMLARYSEAFNVPVSSILFFSEGLDSDGVTKPIRKTVASKIIKILSWIESRTETE